MKEKYIKIFKNLGRNIKNIRKQQNISIKELSIKTKIREEYLKKIEKGNAYGIKTTQLFIISQVLKTKAYILLEDENN